MRDELPRLSAIKRHLERIDRLAQFVNVTAASLESQRTSVSKLWQKQWHFLPASKRFLGEGLRRLVTNCREISIAQSA
jgi:hypothetical protein